MLTESQNIWNNCLKIIRDNIPEQSFNTWFRPIKPVRLLNNVLTIEVPSPFFYEWLEEHYIHLLKKAIISELGLEGKLEYSIVVDKVGSNSQPFTMKIKNPAKQQQKKVPLGELASVTASGNFQRPANGQVSSGYHNPFELPIVQQNDTDSQLNANYLFDTYIEGDCNRLARSAGMAIANKPGITAFNPFVIYGDVGLGKTHLAQAIGNQIKESAPNKFVLYVTSEQFATQFYNALQNNNMQDFTNYYLQVDILIMDDIQFLARKEKTQESFFHIFNRLHQSGRQIIMTSDRPPKELKGLQERLLSRFKWGLTADVQTPGYETRMAIIKRKLEMEGVEIPENVIEFIAYNINSNIRELEGVLVSLIAQASFLRTEIDLELAKLTLMNIVKNTHKELSVEIIQKIVADFFHIGTEDLTAKTRRKHIANARQVAMYLCQKYTDTPLKVIGEKFGGRDHSTVVHASKTVAKKAETDLMFLKNLEDLLNQLEIPKHTDGYNLS